MRIIVDHDRCSAHGRCFALAPELFDLDDDGYSIPLSPEIGPEAETAARNAASNCPESAIRLEDS